MEMAGEINIQVIKSLGFRFLCVLNSLNIVNFSPYGCRYLCTKPRKLCVVSLLSV